MNGSKQLTGRFQQTKKVLTEPGAAFWNEHGLILDFSEHFSAMTSLGIMHHSLTKKEGYLSFVQQPEKEVTLFSHIKNFFLSWDGDSLTLYPKHQHNNLLFELSFCRLVDNFLTYLKELLKAAFINRPEMLRSSEKEQLDFVLQYSSMNDFVNALIEKKVEQLSQEGSGALLKYFDDHGLTLFNDTKSKEDLNLFISLRNIIVHNRGVINSIFLNRVKTYSGKVNEHIKIDYKLFRSYNIRLSELATEIDRRATKHWKLPTLEYTIFIPTTTLRVSPEFSESNIKEYYTESIYHQISNSSNAQKS